MRTVVAVVEFEKKAACVFAVHALVLRSLGFGVLTIVQVSSIY